jgi:hypothetical protein
VELGILAPNWGIAGLDYWGFIELFDYSEPDSRMLLTVEKQKYNNINKEMYNVLSGAEQEGKIFEDKNVSIDGYEAHWILIEMPPIPAPDEPIKTNTTVELHIFMNAGEDGYWFSLTMPVGNENSQLMQDFQTMIFGKMKDERTGKPARSPTTMAARTRADPSCTSRGEKRYPTGASILPTTYRYTGQRQDSRSHGTWVT